MKFNKVKKRVVKYYLDSIIGIDPYDPHDLEEVRKEIANVENYQDLTNLLGSYGFGLYEAGEFIFDAITS